MTDYGQIRLNLTKVAKAIWDARERVEKVERERQREIGLSAWDINTAIAIDDIDRAYDEITRARSFLWRAEGADGGGAE